MVGYEESRQHYQHPERVVVTGTRCGESFSRSPASRRGMPWASRMTGLGAVLLGQLGSRGDERIHGGLPPPGGPDGAPFHHIHGAGRNFAAMEKALAGDHLPPALQVREYIYDMAAVMRAADLVLCRAGASTISELTALGSRR